MSDLYADPTRREHREATGIYVRAIDETERWISADIAQLDVDSLTTWLRSRGGSNGWAESVVRILLGHES